MISMQLIGGDRLIARFGELYPEIEQNLLRAVTKLSFRLETHVKADKLSGQVLKNRTGTLRRSINTLVTMSGNAITGSVGTNKVYARILEYGAQTPPHVILPKRGKALMFQMGGKTIFARSVNHPGSRIPEHSFLRSALRDMKGQIVAGMDAALREAAKI